MSSFVYNYWQKFPKTMILKIAKFPEKHFEKLLFCQTLAKGASALFGRFSNRLIVDAKIISSGTDFTYYDYTRNDNRGSIGYLPVRKDSELLQHYATVGDAFACGQKLEEAYNRADPYIPIPGTLATHEENWGWYVFKNILKSLISSLLIAGASLLSAGVTIAFLYGNI